jgi:hypothetical protein
MCISTVNLRRNCGKTAGGLVPNIYIVNKKDIGTIPAAVAGVVASVPVDTLDNWAVWEGDQNSLQLVVKSVGEGNSKGFETTLELFTAGNNTVFNNHLSENLNAEFIIVCKDRTGKFRLLGSADEGCFLAGDGVNYDTGKKSGDKHGTTLKFMWESAYMPYEVTAAPTPLLTP